MKNRENITAVREACRADTDILCYMLAELFSIENDFTADAEKQRNALKILIDKKTGGVILVAESGSDITGMVNLQKIVSTAAGGYSILLEDLYVKPEYRNTGIGRMLVDKAEEWGRSESALRIQLGADIRNSNALSFYSNAGFNRSNMALHYKYL